jgi:hypothetical protein
MEDAAGNKIIHGELYKKTNFSFTSQEFFNPDLVEIYKIEERQSKLIALDSKGNYFPIEDPGYYDRIRNPVSQQGALDCKTLFPLEGEKYKVLKENLLKSKKKTSILLKMLEKEQT